MAKVHEDAERDYLLGMKYKDIAAKYGVALATVKSWKLRYKWEKVKVKKKAKTKAHTKEKVAKEKVCKKSPSIIPVFENESLTEKQKLFCMFYVKNFNATQAAIRAGYSKNSAMEQGYQLVRKTSVREEIERLKRIKFESIMLSEEDIVERYMRIAFADMTDFVEFGTESIPYTDKNGCMHLDFNGELKMVKREYFNFKDHDQVDGGLIKEISVGRSGMKMKLHDQEKALRWLSDYFGMHPAHKHKVAYDNAVLRLRERELELKEW